MAAEQYVPADELAVIPEQQIEVVPEQETTETAPPAFDPSALTEEQIAAVLAQERAKPLVERIAQSEADRRLEAARNRAWQERLQQEAAAESARRRQLLLNPPDEDEAKEQLYQEERQRVLQEQRYAEAQRLAAQTSAQQIAVYFQDLPDQDKRELATLSGEVMAGRMSEQQLWNEAMARRDRSAQARWEADRAKQADEERRVRQAEAVAEAATAPRPRPDLGNSRGGGSLSITSLSDARAAHARGDISSAEMRQYLAAFRDT